MVRLVFRPYAQVGRTICTSVPRRTSTRISSGFVLLKHSSPSFGSYRTCSTSKLFERKSPGGGDYSITEITTRKLRKLFTFISPRVVSPLPNDSHVRKTPRSVFQDGRMTTIMPNDLECTKTLTSQKNPRIPTLYDINSTEVANPINTLWTNNRNPHHKGNSFLSFHR